MRVERIQLNPANTTPKIHLLIVLVSFFLVLLFFTAYSATQVTVTDELGHKVVLPQFPPKRIVSLAPNITEILFALGLESRIVGVTDYCDYPERAKSKPKIGGFSNPNLEQIIALRPDVIILTADSNQDAIANQLARLNLPYYVINPESIFGILTTIRRLGEVTGTVPQAESLIQQLEQRILQVQRRTQGVPKPNVLFLWSEQPLITAGQGTFTDSLISLAGGNNLAHNAKIKYPKYSLEEIIRQQPEVIIVANMLNQADTTVYTRWQKWQQIPAVRNHRVYSINSDIIARPSPRIIEGLETLETLIHR
ncbi:MAG: cobalamin-binding protein [bacterium]|nr:cobalamin-binding protein [bacterium]